MDGVQNLLCELRSHAARMHANRMANSINQPAVARRPWALRVPRAMPCTK